MAKKRVLIIQGHPDPATTHLGHALADAYSKAAHRAGHEIRVVLVAKLDFPILQNQKDWEHGVLPESLAQAQADIAWAEHIVFFFPLWLGDMPAILKAFLEQIARPGFAFKKEGKNPFGIKGLTGRSARIVVTMGMPALVYRWYFGAHSVRSLELNILGFIGIAPIHKTMIGLVDRLGEKGVAKWIKKLDALGSQAS